MLLVALAALGAGQGCIVYNEECLPVAKDPSEVTGWLGGDVSTLKAVVRTQDNSIGQLVAQTYYNAFPSALPDFTFENAGSVRSEGICASHDSVPMGPVTREVLREVLPFDNTLITVLVTHRQLKNAFEHAIAGLSPSGTASPPGSFLQLWGGTVEANCNLTAETLNSDGTRKQEGQRVTSITLQRRDGTSQSIPLSPPSDTETVRIATNSYLLGGGDGYLDLKAIDITDTKKSGYAQAGYNFEPIAAFFLATYTQAGPLPAKPAARWVLTDCH